jgi:hypothetical protein
VKRFFSKELAVVCISVVFYTWKRTVIVVVDDDFMNSSDSFPASMAQRIALILLPLMTSPPPPPHKVPLERALETGRKTYSLHFSRDAQHSFLDARIFFRESLPHSSHR